MERKKHSSVRTRPSRKRNKAASIDVLARLVRPKRIKPKWKKHYRDLIDLRDYLLRQRGNLTQAAQEEKVSFSQHMADAGTDSYDRDFTLGMLSTEQNALYEIEEAIRRIENGTCGICELTGRPIEAARLAAIPWTRFFSEGGQRIGKARRNATGPPGRTGNGGCKRRRTRAR